MAWYDPFDVKGMANSYMHPEEGYDAAEEQFRKFWEQAQNFQQPYNQAGQRQIPILEGAENKLLDPSALLDEWMGKYKTSDYAKQSMANAKGAGMDSASSMGLLGSSAALQNIQNSSSQIMNKDRQAFLDDLMKKFMAGIGLGQNMFNTGAGTASNLGQQALSVGGTMGDNAYNRQNSRGKLMQDLMNMGLKLYGGGAGAAA